MAVLLGGVLCGCADKSAPPRELAGADARRGLDLMTEVGCGACHDIPGIDWPRGALGGPLEGFARRPMIAGRFPNQPGVLIAWIRNAPVMAPDTAMPASLMSERDARDVAAYLYGLDER
ncbi:c-type cytochrome [Phenylobacterium sp. LjRoot164]|uniref:c-type cytochrome n=2 Tax=unclassified Phenylobacterium TaxID=2640670 RepID=UPI003F5048B9